MSVNVDSLHFAFSVKQGILGFNSQHVPLKFSHYVVFGTKFIQHCQDNRIFFFESLIANPIEKNFNDLTAYCQLHYFVKLPPDIKFNWLILFFNYIIK